MLTSLDILILSSLVYLNHSFLILPHYVFLNSNNQILQSLKSLMFKNSEYWPVQIILGSKQGWETEPLIG